MADEMDKDAELVMGIVIGGNLCGEPSTGFLTNPERGKKPEFIEINGEKIVCLAQGGECRFNSDYYTMGLNDRKSWTTPIIDEYCPDRCPYKVLVCDEHSNEECVHSVTRNPDYNKFRGQFARYCRTFSRLEKKIGGEK